jgi:lysophospholipase L1-like esterase
MMRTLTGVLLILFAALGLAGCNAHARPAGPAGAARPGAVPAGPAGAARPGAVSPAAVSPAVSPAAVSPAAPPVPSAHQAAHTTRPGNGRRQWVTSWAASPQAAHAGVPGVGAFRDRTVRDIVFLSAGGDALRLVLTNAYGTTPLRVGEVTVGLAGAGAGVMPGGIHLVRFGGRAEVQIPAGAQAVSDPLAMRVPALRDLAVSIYLPARAARPTIHLDAQQHTWVSVVGDHAAATSAAAFPWASRSWFYLTGVIVFPARASGTVVAFGDSITDGLRSTFDANARWPNDLARRLAARAGRTLSVADEGISGDHLLATSPQYPGALARFGADALDQPGVRDIIVEIGINDIRTGAASAQQVIAGYEQLIGQAHARGLKIFGATLLPFQGTGGYTPAREAAREAVNAWIRTSGAFDGVIDFDALMRSPADPLSMRRADDSGDNLHPSDAGYRAMAAAISLPMLLSA